MLLFKYILTAPLSDEKKTFFYYNDIQVKN